MLSSYTLSAFALKSQHNVCFAKIFFVTVFFFFFLFFFSPYAESAEIKRKEKKEIALVGVTLAAFLMEISSEMLLFSGFCLLNWNLLVINGRYLMTSKDG